MRVIGGVYSIDSKREQDAAELGANTYANHICTNIFEIFFGR